MLQFCKQDSCTKLSLMVEPMQVVLRLQGGGSRISGEAASAKSVAKSVAQVSRQRGVRDFMQLSEPEEPAVQADLRTYELDLDLPRLKCLSYESPLTLGQNCKKPPL